MEDNLNANHRRALTATLSLIGQMMHETLQEIDSTQKNVFVRHINPGIEEEQQRIRSVINEIDLFLQHLKEKYHLMEEVRDIQWMLRVRKSKALELLADTSPQRLQAGGPLSPEMAHRLESDLEELRRILETLC
jgi:DNA topoisomerase VI subunit A